MKKTIITLITLALMSGCAFSKDWVLGVQTWSFRTFSFCETLDQLSAMGVEYVEMYPGQKIGGGIEGSIHHTMDADTRSALQKKLSAAGIKIVSYGVLQGENEADWRKIFEFVQAMDFKIINSEPNQEDYDLLVKLTQEYEVDIGIHNHAKPDNRYWKPQTTLNVVKDRPGLFAAPDNGHWARSGIRSVDGFKLLEGQMISIHLKDMKIFDDTSQNICVPFGEGINDLSAVIDELKRQNYNGNIIIEFESHPENPTPYIKKCVDWFNANAK